MITKNLLNDMKSHALLYLVLSAMFHLTFYGESVLVVQRYLGSLYWMIILPGTTLLLGLMPHLGFPERAAAGAALGFIISGIAGYYLGLAGIHVALHGWILPPAILCTGIILLRRESEQ